MPDLFCSGMQFGNFWTNSLPTSICLDSQAIISGVSFSALRDIPSSSWPASTRNSWLRCQQSFLSEAASKHTAISTKPCFAAKCRDVLLLSSKSGFWRDRGLFRTMRLTSRRSFSTMARRRRVATSILYTDQQWKPLVMEWHLHGGSISTAMREFERCRS